MDKFVLLKTALRGVLPALELREQEPMSKHTSFRIGGPLALMALPKDEQEATVCLRLAEEAGIVPLFLGKGSNLLVADEGVRRFGIKLASNSAQLRLLEPELIEAPAGLPLAQIAAFAAEHGLAGMEFAHGIPGSLGGAIFMNAGAYEGEMSQIVEEVSCRSLRGEVQHLTAADCDFSYRHSAFCSEERLILSARLRLVCGERAEIVAKMAELMERRRSKQPLEYPSGGSTFKRPPGQFAGALIEKAGLKGASVGGAQVSEKHAGFVVNTGGASCEDVLRLMRTVRQKVEQETGLCLEPELRLLGCEF